MICFVYYNGIFSVAVTYFSRLIFPHSLKFFLR
jgi:hypothetical protein